MTYNYFLRKSTNRNLSLRIGDAFDWLNNLDRVFIGSNIRTCISMLVLRVYEGVYIRYYSIIVVRTM